ncbi:hypothetical protein ACFQ1Q_03830 [Winogradskyella litorisediminis]|uniref:SWIM-type domain-containing protein n=1 Tax=Winogradskyella litorisediminis TaxID=1156618 RepID=A0ABW3N619_9FLAO
MSCEEETITEIEQLKTIQEVRLEISTLSKTKNYNVISETLNNVYQKSPLIRESTNYSQERSATDFENTFIVDTTSVKYIETNYSHSYTFALNTISATDSITSIKNLLLAKHNNMDEYLPMLVTYNLTEQELIAINDGEIPLTYTNQPIFERLEGFDLVQLGMFRCTEFTTTYTFTIPCSCHTDEDHEAAPCGHPQGEVIFTISEIGACSDSGGVAGSSGNDSGGTSNNGGGTPIDWGGAEYSPYNPDNNNSQDILAEGPVTQINPPLRSIVRTDMADLLDFHDTNFLNNYPHMETAFNSYLSNNSDTDGYQFIDWSIDYLQYMFLSGQPLITGEDSLNPEHLDYFNTIVNSNLSNEEIIAELDFHQLAQEVIADGGNVDYEDRIYEDSSFKNTEIECMHDELLEGDEESLYNLMIANFKNDNDVLTLKVADIGEQWGITHGNSANNTDWIFDYYTITYSDDINNASNLAKMVTLCHEIIHAFMYDTLDDMGIITYEENGNPELNILCPDIPANVNLNTLTAQERWVALLCAFNSNSVAADEEWVHSLFNTSTFILTTYRQALQDFLFNNHNWHGESEAFKTSLQNQFGTAWRSKTAEYMSWQGLEHTDEFIGWAVGEGLSSQVGTNGSITYPAFNELITLVKLQGKKNCL